MREDHPAHLVRELEAPRAHEWDEQRRVQDRGLSERGRAEPEDLGRDGEREGQQEEERREGALGGGEPVLEDVDVA